MPSTRLSQGKEHIRVRERERERERKHHEPPNVIRISNFHVNKAISMFSTSRMNG